MHILGTKRRRGENHEGLIPCTVAKPSEGLFITISEVPLITVDEEADETPVVTGPAVADIEPAVLGTGPAVQNMEPAVSDREPAVRDKGLSLYGISHNILMPECDIDRAVKHLRESGGPMLYIEVFDMYYGIQKAALIKDKLQEKATKGYLGVVESKYIAMQEFNCVIAYHDGSFVNGLSRLHSGPEVSICGYSFSFSKAICDGMNEINVAVKKDPSSRGQFQDCNFAIQDCNFIVSHRVRLLMVGMDHAPAHHLMEMMKWKLIFRSIRHPWDDGYQRIWWIGNIGGVHNLPPVTFCNCYHSIPEWFTRRGLDSNLPSIQTVMVQGRSSPSDRHHFRMEMMLRPFALSPIGR